MVVLCSNSRLQDILFPKLNFSLTLICTPGSTIIPVFHFRDVSSASPVLLSDEVLAMRLSHPSSILLEYFLYFRLFILLLFQLNHHRLLFLSFKFKYWILFLYLILLLLNLTKIFIKQFILY